MYERCRNLLLRILKVPLQPHPPAGDPASVRVFRAGRNYFRLRLFGWGLAQGLALAGIVFWAVVLIEIEDAARVQKQARLARAQATRESPTTATSAPAGPALSSPAASPSPAPAAAGAPAIDSANPPASVPPGAAPKEFVRSVTTFRDTLVAKATKAAKPGRGAREVGVWASFKPVLVELALLLPPWAFPLIWLLKILGFTVYLVQIPITYAVRRLDYEMHWYVVTDRSLRLRTGVWNVQELTMSFANLQQVVVTQGPLQRLLGLGDVRVQSAGGAGSEHTREAQQNSMHSGYFHSVDNAAEIRDLILDRLRRFRESGLGDPDEIRRVSPPVSPEVASGELLAAAGEFRDEARALRRAVS